MTALDDTTPAASMSVEHSAQANQHNIDNAAPELTEEERLRELVKLRMKRKVSAEVSGDRSSANKVVVPSKHLRIDNFQRPLNQKSLTEFLTIKLGVSFVDGDIWLNGIKTHCYVDFSDVESATQAKAHLEGERWPTTNPKPLEVSYTSVSAKDAPTSAEAAMRPGEWHKACAVVVSKTANDCTPESGAESVLGKRKIEPTSAAMSMFKNAIAGANTVGSGANRARDVTTLQRLEGSTDTGFSTRRSAETGIISENSGPKQLGLDDLFCKTMSKPQLYWLPLTEDEVARKKMAKSKAESDPLRG